MARIYESGLSRSASGDWQSSCTVPHSHIVLNEHYEADGATVYREACKLGYEGIVSKRIGSPYRPGRSNHWIKIKNPAAPAVKREAEEEWS